MRGRHAPVISVPGSFLRPGKGTADHYRIRPAGKRFANIAPLVHSPIRDDRHITARLFMIGVPSGRTVHRRRHLRHPQT